MVDDNDYLIENGEVGMKMISVLTVPEMGTLCIK